MNAITSYFHAVIEEIGQNWNRFWFARADVFPVCVLRIIAGMFGLLYVFSHTFDLLRWFGPEGLLPIETVRLLTGGGPDAPTSFRLSYFNLTSDPTQLWILHVAGLVVLACFTIGFRARITGVLSLIVVLSYVHRAPMITGQVEAVLTMVLFYLMFAPTGACLSIDARKETRSAPPEPSLAANISLRLIQLHLVAFYLAMGLSKLGASTVWWTGDAVWWLAARPESRLVDLTFLASAMPIVNIWTHSVVLFELSWPFLIWNRLARPLVIAISILMWGSLALVTGLVGFCALLVCLNIAFIPACELRRVLNRSAD